MKQDKSLKNKVVFITGASSGIGRALAYHYARAGANVILAGLELDAISIIEKELTEKFQKCLAVKCNVDFEMFKFIDIFEERNEVNSNTISEIKSNDKLLKFTDSPIKENKSWII